MANSTLEYQAWLWDGRQQIPGRLKLCKYKLSFEIASFPQSNLRLDINYEDILQTEEVLLFDLAHRGLRIHTSDGRSDLFVLEDLEAFKKALRDRLPTE